jgi:tetratricopeptide (TPR) repeat protein
MKRKGKQAPAARPPASSAALVTRRRYLAAAAFLCFLTLAAFSNSFWAGFALDNHMLVEDTRLQAANTENISLIFRHTYLWLNGESGLYRPLTSLSYLFNYAILGNANRPAGYHGINLLLHLANVLLVFTIVRRLAGGGRAAFLIAMLWAVHPVLTESVTNIVGRADLLAGFAVLSSLLLYFESDSMAALIGIAVLTAIGVFSKESAVVLPGVIVLYELAFEKRWRRMLFGCAATLVPIGLMLWQRWIVLSAAPPAEYPFVDNPIVATSFWIGRLTAIKVLGRYLLLAIWPVKLSADYSYAEISLARGSFEDWVCWLGVLAAVIFALFLRRRSRLAFFFAGFAFLNLLPTSNLLFPIGTIMAERLLYLPLAGLVAAVILAIDASIVDRRAFMICVAMIGFAFLVRTWLRNRDWTDDKTMAMASVVTSPHSFNPHRLLAAVLFEGDPSHRDIDGAMAEADRSVAILAPLADELDLPDPWNLAAVCHRAKGDALKGDGARAQYEVAAKLAQRSVDIEAASRGAYDRAHKIKSPVSPNAGAGYRTLASAYLHLGDPAKALAAAQAAKTIDVANAAAYAEIADAEVAEGHGEEAAIALAEGIFASGDRNLLTELLDLYRSGVDSKGCAVRNGPHGPTLNPSCEIVMKDLCQAIDRVHRPDLAPRFGCVKQ